jgi:hypothetical protein
MDVMATDSSDASSDYFWYKPTDPNLRGSPALSHLQWCIDEVESEAVKSGNSRDLVRSHLSQHQTQFDAVLGTLGGVFRLRDADQTTAARSDNITAASLDTAQKQRPETISRVRHSRPLNLQQPKWRGPAARNSAARLVVPRSTRQYKPQNTDSMEKHIQQKSMDAQQNPSDEDRRAKLEQQIRAMAAIKAAAPSHFRASFAREPQFGSGNPDYMANQTQNRSIAARQDLSDEDCRAEHFGNWLEDLPKLPDNIEHRLIHSDTTPAMTPSSAATNSTVMTGATLPPTNSTASPLILPAEKCRLVPIQSLGCTEERRVQANVQCQNTRRRLTIKPVNGHRRVWRPTERRVNMGR